MHEAYGDAKFCFVPRGRKKGRVWTSAVCTPWVGIRGGIYIYTVYIYILYIYIYIEYRHLNHLNMICKGYQAVNEHDIIKVHITLDFFAET